MKLDGGGHPKPNRLVILWENNFEMSSKTLMPFFRPHSVVGLCNTLEILLQIKKKTNTEEKIEKGMVSLQLKLPMCTVQAFIDGCLRLIC